MSNMQERIREALRNATERGQLNEAWAIPAIMAVFEESLPNAVDEDGSQGKWVNGWNDYREYMVESLKQSKEVENG